MDLNSLNLHQKLAVLDNSPACLVSAHVGSGKTTVLIEKVFYLHEVRKVPFSEMVVLTFTNKAANEIKDRIRKEKPEISADELRYFGTFHSVALEMLKTFLPVDSIGFTKDFSVMDVPEKTELARELIISNQLNIKFENKIEKRLDQAAQGKILYGNMRYDDDIMELLALLQEAKQAQNKMDFDDLLKNAIRLLPQTEYRPQWIVIDEFQDTNTLQMDYICVLHGPETRIFAVGDPNQIIYSWRGSNKDIFIQFKREFQATEMSLPENYRSCTTILEVAKCFLSGASDLKGIRETGSKITVKNHYSPFIEAQYFAERIEALHTSGVQYSDIAVFYRLQKQSKVLEDVFSRAGIPYEVSAQRKLESSPVIAWFTKVLRISVNTKDVDTAIACLSDTQYGERFTKQQARRIVENQLLENGLSSACMQGSLFEQAEDYCDTARSNLLEKCISFRKWSQTHSCKDISAYFDIDSYINPTAASFAEDKDLINAVLDIIERFVAHNAEQLFDGVQEFLNTSVLNGIDALIDKKKTSEDAVRLMTLHAAKGLEFQYVFIVGVNQGLIPLRTQSSEEESEERRLFFVGITRAKDYLELSYYTSPEEQRVRSGPSDYLLAIPRRLIVQEDSKPEAAAAASLQSYRHAVLTAIANREGDEVRQNTEVSVPERVVINKARHDKYGVGIITHETDEMISIQFEGYGEKEFFKALCSIERLPDDGDDVVTEQVFAALHDTPDSTGQGKSFDESTQGESTGQQLAGILPESILTINSVEKSMTQQVRHRKYGIGTVLQKSDGVVTVAFEGYGEKEFLEAFGELEYLPEASAVITISGETGVHEASYDTNQDFQTVIYDAAEKPEACEMDKVEIEITEKDNISAKSKSVADAAAKPAQDEPEKQKATIQSSETAESTLSIPSDMQDLKSVDTQIIMQTETCAEGIRSIEESFTTDVHSRTLEEKERSLSDLQKEYASLAFFKRREKKRLQAQIRKLEAEISYPVSRHPDLTEYQTNTNKEIQKKRRFF